jgi:hypothetical protein
MRYALLGLLLLLGAGGLYCLTKEPEPGPVANVPEDAGTALRTNTFEPEIEIPEEEPDAGDPDTGPEEVETTMMSTMRVRVVECNGQVDRAGLTRVIAQHRSQVRSCYERRLKVNNVLQGRVNVTLRIGRTGAVEQVRVGGSLRDNEVFACVRRLAQSWTFPAVAGNCADVSVPFNLTPRP